MKNKLIVFAAALLAIAAIIFVLTRQSSPGADGSPIAQTQTVDAKQLPQIAQTIIQSGDVAKCASVNTVLDGVNYETVCRNNIAWNAAQASLDIKACDGLDDKLMSIADCQSSIISKLVVKNQSLTVCDQFAGNLKNLCVNDHWSILAVSENDPSQCMHLVVSSSQAGMNCEENVLMSLATNPSSTLQCSLFVGVAKTDCSNLNNGACQSLTFRPLQQFCQQKRK